MDLRSRFFRKVKAMPPGRLIYATDVSLRIRDCLLHKDDILLHGCC